jgi:hypothetical protein
MAKTPKAKEVKEGRKTLFEVLATPDTSAIHTGQLNGQEHLVVPVVALVEGVLHSANAENPELALANEFGRYPEAWNGRPLVMNHPQVNGDFVSANSPQVLEDWSFGKLFNTRLEDGRLKTEAWIDVGKVNALGGEAQQTVNRINDGEMVEVSTGLFATVEQAPGTFEGKDYAGIWRSVAPDHLAFLSEGLIGACSVEDGAGVPRLNVNMRYATTNTTTDEAPAKAEGTSTMAQIAISRHERAFERLSSLIPNSFPSDMLDSNVRILLKAAFEKQGVDLFHIYAFNQDTVTYERWDSLNIYQRGFTIESEEEGAVLDDEEVQVQMLTKIVTAADHPGSHDDEDDDEDDDDEKMNQLSNPQKENTMAKTPKAQVEPVEGSDAVVAEPTTGDPSPDVVDATTTDAAQPIEEPAGEEQLPVTDPEADAHSLPITAEQYLESAPEEIGDVLREGLALHKERKTNTVARLLANDRNEYSEGELQAMKMRDLERIDKLATVPTYIGKSPPGERVNVADNTPPPPPQAFPITKAE